MTRRLVVIAEQPIPGATKTRLCPPLTPDQAADLYSALLLDTLDLARRAQSVDDSLHLAIAYTPMDAAAYFSQLAPDFELLFQEGPDLGARLHHVLSLSLAMGHLQVAAIGSDSPVLPAAFIGQAFDHLEAGADVVLGPAEDGGYYLIAMSQPQPTILLPVQMSTPQVLSDTLALAEQAGLRVTLLPTWPDVDTMADVRLLVRLLNQLSAEHAPATRAALQTLGLL